LTSAAFSWPTFSLTQALALLLLLLAKKQHSRSS
jgi:hypothetical protein